jgi:hypothetical protein
MIAQKCRDGSKATISIGSGHVRFTPNSDRPNGRYVPLATKVQRSNLVGT